ncbi:MAG TPA: Kiwa anti-phage protein KwaB-like domain-containing protein [Candidatus Saccharimonadales bacterium]|nr:Kiwa anti-phage protein KwaB-like domain-containing protein [Candidatus Saccharimonadales bacterium]
MEPTAEATLPNEQPQETAAVTPVATDDTDIFAWANNLFLYKDKLSIELFLLNKSNILYSTRYAENLNRQLHALFIDLILEYIITGAGQGLVVRGFEEAENEENVLQYTKVENVDKLVEAMSWLGTQEKDMESFSEEDHDLKRMRGIIARCTHPDMPRPFYVIKALSTSNVLKGSGAWMMNGTKFEALDDGAALRIPADNQLLIVDDELYVFNQSKLERLFGYNAKKNAIAEKKAKQIEAHFSLSFAEEKTLQGMVKESKPLINKLQKIDPSAIKQDALLDHAEEMGVELMVDENGAIIIMDQKDLSKFVNLLNDDYVESALTGNRYEIKSKKLLVPSEES